MQLRQSRATSAAALTAAPQTFVCPLSSVVAADNTLTADTLVELPHTFAAGCEVDVSVGVVACDVDDDAPVQVSAVSPLVYRVDDDASTRGLDACACVSAPECLVDGVPVRREVSVTVQRSVGRASLCRACVRL